MILYLVRHGNTDWTGKRLIGNTPGIHLSQLGRAQAKQLALYLGQFPLQAIFTSPLERAVETAFPLATLLKMIPNPADFLREIDFGELQGLSTELASLDIWQQFSTHPAKVHFPGGESVIEAQNRVYSGLNDLAVQFADQDQIVCFAHCEILRLAVASALHIPLDEYMRLTIDPGSISCLHWTLDHQTVRFLNLRVVS